MMLVRNLKYYDASPNGIALSSSSYSHILNLSYFKDDSSPNGIALSSSSNFWLGLLNPFLSDIKLEMVVVLFSAWDYSAWVRSYALFLEERLECYRVLKYDIETERLVSSPLYLKFFMHAFCYNS